MIWLNNTTLMTLHDDVKHRYFGSGHGWIEGGEACFHPMNGKVNDIRPLAIKVYEKEHDRNRAHYIQRKVSYLGYAPPVGSTFTFYIVNQHRKTDRLYGLFTCMADMIYKKNKAFEKKISALGFTSDEMVSDNLGIWRDRPVIVDFGEYSYIRKHKKTCPSCMFCEVMDEI